VFEKFLLLDGRVGPAEFIPVGMKGCNLFIFHELETCSEGLFISDKLLPSYPEMPTNVQAVPLISNLVQKFLMLEDLQYKNHGQTIHALGLHKPLQLDFNFFTQF
jgi:hypothetical protein